MRKWLSLQAGRNRKYLGAELVMIGSGARRPLIPARAVLVLALADLERLEQKGVLASEEGPRPFRIAPSGRVQSLPIRTEQILRSIGIHEGAETQAVDGFDGGILPRTRVAKVVSGLVQEDTLHAHPGPQRSTSLDLRDGKLLGVAECYVPVNGDAFLGSAKERNEVLRLSV